MNAVTTPAALSTLRRFAFAAALSLSVAACAGDRALFPETSYNQVGQGQIELTKSVTIFGNWELPVGTRVQFQLAGFQQRIKEIVTPQDITLDKVTIPAQSNLEFAPYGSRLVMSRVTLGADTEYQNIRFKKKDKVSFNDDGTVSEAFLATKRTIDGKTYPAETALWFKDGEVTRSETQSDRDAAAAERHRQYQSCTAGCAPYTGEVYANCMNHCSSM